jgi:SAM-dependent methyltransferase
LTAYALVFLPFPRKNLVFIVLLAALMVPIHVTILPNYLTIADLGWLNTYQGIILPGASVAFGTFLLRQHFLTLPIGILEAARLEGVGHLQMLWYIVLPLSRPVLVTVGLIALVNKWNDFLWPLIVTNRLSMRVLPVGLAYLYDQEGNSQWGIIMAATIFVVLPIIVIFVWAQRHITPRHPNFRFQVADVHNQTYNPAGRQPADRYVFPFPDASFDFVFMTSVLTHMLPAEVERYLGETARVLRPGGRCLITWFLLDEESRPLLEQGRTMIGFPEDRGSHRLMDAKLPEENVAYDIEEARRLYAACGLAIREPIRGGSWAARANPTSYQDVVVAEKA